MIRLVCLEYFVRILHKTAVIICQDERKEKKMFLKMFCVMVLILDGNSESVAHAIRKICVFGEKKMRFMTALDLIKCLKQIK